ncbi:MAG: hypothetical protein CMC76_09125 [Flavobacteriaceae bacterium]|nr:hypothetical protein [Flavobacteriaceae bacterium]
MIDFIKLIEETEQLLSNSSSLKIVEGLFINKYGSEEKAKEAFKAILEQSKKNDNLQELIFSEFGLDKIIRVLNSFKEASNLKETYENLQNEKLKLIKEETPKSKEELLNNLELLSNAAHQVDISETSKDNLINYINENVIFNLANTRKELGYPDPRPFNYWLKFFFQGKYNDKINEGNSKNSGKLTLFEYLEVVSAFLLSYDEGKIDYSNPEKMLKRFELQKKTQKQVLKYITNNNYSYLKEKLEDLYISDVYRNKFGDQPFDTSKRKIPYSICSVIKKHIEEEYFD